MKKQLSQILPVIIMVIFSGPLYSQDYKEFNFESGVWIEEFSYKDGAQGRSQKYCRGDSTVNAVLYYRLYENSIIGYPPAYYPDTVENKYLGLIRQSDDMKVSYIPKDADHPVTIYDFNLEPGDSIEGVFDGFRVREIDSVEICGEYHKRYSEFEGTTALENTLTEGIGFSNGLLGYNEYFYHGGENMYFMSCYLESDKQDCSGCQLVVGEKIYEIILKLYPNPFREHIEIQSSEPMREIAVFDISGRLVLRKKTNYESAVQLDMKHVGKGIYLLKIRYADQKVSASEMLKL